MKTIISILFLLLSFVAFGQVDKPVSIVGYWFYQDGYTTKQLILKKNNRFNWYFSSCEGDVCFKGKFKFKSDTIYLKTRKSELVKFVYRNEFIYSYAGREKDYPDFEPLKISTNQTRLKCNFDEIEIIEIEENN